jgi:pilus assembly protein CpaE
MAEKILIVDDDLETLRLVGLMLERQGYQIHAANSGPQALAMAQAEQPDLIILDVMMPEMDGIEVTLRLRENPSTEGIPILLFTAKSQVDDKVIGFEAGADDYLTKPTHPAELNAHVKALLSRTVKKSAIAPATPRGRVIGVLAARGGLGVTTLALNLGLGIRHETKEEVIVVELRPGQGTMALDLGHPDQNRLGNLLNKKIAEITPEAIENEIITDSSGVKLLMSSYNPKEASFVNAVAEMETLVNQVSTMANYTIVDIGNSLSPNIDGILKLCNEIVIVLEPQTPTVTRTKALIEELVTKGFGKARHLNIALVNRVRSDVQLSWIQVQEMLGIPITTIFTPVPELIYQASLRHIPLFLLQKDSIISQAFIKLADTIIEHNAKG